MDRLVDHLFVFEGNGIIRDFPGNYSDYRLEDKPSIKESKSGKPEAVKIKSVPTESKEKLTFKERYELETLEKELPKLESAKNSLESSMQTETEYQKLAEIGKEIKGIEVELEEKEIRWLELSERA